MKVPALAAGVGEPFAYGLGLVRREVVQDDVDVEMGRGVKVDPFAQRQHVS